MKAAVGDDLRNVVVPFAAAVHPSQVEMRKGVRRLAGCSPIQNLVAELGRMRLNVAYRKAGCAEALSQADDIRQLVRVPLHADERNAQLRLFCILTDNDGPQQAEILHDLREHGGFANFPITLR